MCATRGSFILISDTRLKLQESHLRNHKEAAALTPALRLPGCALRAAHSNRVAANSVGPEPRSSAVAVGFSAPSATSCWRSRRATPSCEPGSSRNRRQRGFGYVSSHPLGRVLEAHWGCGPARDHFAGRRGSTPNRPFGEHTSGVPAISPTATPVGPAGIRSTAEPAASLVFRLYPALMLADPRLSVGFGSERADSGRIALRDDDLHAERPVGERDHTIGRLGVGVSSLCHWLDPLVTGKNRRSFKWRAKRSRRRGSAPMSLRRFPAGLPPRCRRCLRPPRHRAVRLVDRRSFLL